MAIFTIDVTLSPLTTGIYLEHRHVKPDGTLTNWTTYLGVGINGLITITPPTTSYTYTNISLNDNTVYQFRVKELCQDNTTLYSNITDDLYAVNCNSVVFGVNLGAFDYTSQEYPMLATFSPTGGFSNPFNTNDYSISGYTIIIQHNQEVPIPGGGVTQINHIDYINVSVVAGVNSTGYTYTVTSDDLVDPIELGKSYTFSLQYRIILSDGTIVNIEDCENPRVLTIPMLKTYKIYANSAWIVDWVDENNVHQRLCANIPGTNTDAKGKYFIIHHISTTGATNPICGYCITSGNTSQVPGTYNPMYILNTTDLNAYCYPTTGGVVPTGYLANNPSPFVCNISTDPVWGAQWKELGLGYIVISGTNAPPAGSSVNSVCTGAPNW